MLNSEQRYTASLKCYPITLLNQGSTGTEAIDLQHSLQQRGFNPGAIDGNFGSLAHTAVYRFQLSQELSSTGGVDLETWRALDNAV